MDKILKTAIRAAKQAGSLLLGEYRDFDRRGARLKSSQEIVTRCDLLSEELILGEINKIFPGHGILSEERGESRGRDFLWVVDPLDGTTNFTIHDPLWAVSIAVAELTGDGPEIRVGVIYAPVLEELYVAEFGNGAQLNGRPIRVSDQPSQRLIHTFCHGKTRKDLVRAIAYYRRQKLGELDCRQLGSAALELAYTAAGRVESYVSPGACDWDVAAGALLVAEAGGRVTDFRGRDWRLGGGDMAATNGRAHIAVLKAVNGR